jgi:hypothetical protein
VQGDDECLAAQDGAAAGGSQAEKGEAVLRGYGVEEGCGAQLCSLLCGLQRSQEGVVCKRVLESVRAKERRLQEMQDLGSLGRRVVQKAVLRLINGLRELQK